MRTAEAHLRRGVGTRILKHLLDKARRRSYRQLSLETGSMDAFAPARRLYERFGFEECPFRRLLPRPLQRLYDPAPMRKNGPPEPSARFAVRFRSHERRSPEPW